MPSRPARLLPLVSIILAGASLLPAVPTVDDFFKHPEISSLSISPDGRYVAYLTPANKEDYDMNAFDFVQGEPLKFALSKEKFRGFYWLDENQIVLQSWRQVIFDVNKRKITHSITPTARDADDYRVFSQIKDRPGHFYVLYYQRPAMWPTATVRNQQAFGIINVKRNPGAATGMNNARYNQVSSLSIPAGETHNAYTDQRGEIRVISIYRDGNLRYHYRQPNDIWTELPLDPLRVEIKAFTDDPGQFYAVQRNEETGASSLRLYNAAKQEMGGVIFQDEEYSLDVADVQLSRNGKDLLGLAYARDRPVQIALSPAFKEVLARANKALPDRVNVIVNYDEALRHFSIASLTDRDIRVLILENGPRGFMELAAVAPQLPAQIMRPMRVVRFASRDGLKLEGYLTLPDVDSGGPKPPLLVMPHDGPWQRDIWGFNRTVQFFASRGYAVFQPNYRGSTGYAKSISLDGEYAFRKMHDDITDGVKYIASTGNIDPARIGVFGSGFGGFLALSGVAFESDLYRCAATYAGIFDWKKIVEQRKDGSTYDRFAYDYMIKRLGDPAKDRTLFDDISPIGHLQGVKTPVFVAHGNDDTDVDVTQSRKLLAELRKLNVPTASLFLSGENHDIYNVENEVKLYTALEAFLEKYLKAAPNAKN